jgi:hypothetical protein
MKWIATVDNLPTDKDRQYLTFSPPDIYRLIMPFSGAKCFPPYVTHWCQLNAPSQKQLNAATEAQRDAGQPQQPQGETCSDIICYYCARYDFVKRGCDGIPGKSCGIHYRGFQGRKLSPAYEKEPE